MTVRLNPKRMVGLPRSRVGLHAPSGFDPNAPRLGARAVNESIAPVCPITRSEVPPSQPGIRLPSIPRATDLDSAIKAINAIGDIINEESSGAGIRWLEQYRVTAIVRIFNPEDDSQWVDVERIMKLVMEDQITGELWVWELEHQQQAPAPIPPSEPTQLTNYDPATGRWVVVSTPPTDPTAPVVPVIPVTVP